MLEVDATTPSVTAIIPCAGFGTRVAHLLGTGCYKENVRAPNGEPVLWQHLDLAVSYPNVKDVVIILNTKKDETLECIKEWGLSRNNRKYTRAISNCSREVESKTTTNYMLSQCQLQAVPSTHPSECINTGMFIRFPKVYSDLNIYIVSIGKTLSEALITQNPKETIVGVKNVLPKTLPVFDSDRDLLITFPDIYYTDFKAVTSAFEELDSLDRSFKLCAIDPKVYTTADPQHFGRVEVVDGKITKVVSVLDEDYVPNEKTYSEVGILCGRMDKMLDDHNTWFYDSMIEHGNICPITIESDIIDYGNPANHTSNPDEDDDDIRDVEDQEEYEDLE